MEEIKRILRERKERKATAAAFGTREPSRCETCGRIEGRNKAYGMEAGNVRLPFNRPSNPHGLTVRLTVWVANSRSRYNNSR